MSCIHSPLTLLIPCFLDPQVLSMKMGCVLLDMVLVAVGVLVLAAQTAALPTGAPPKACIEMIPGHGAQGVGTIPFVIDIESSPDNIYMAGQLVTGKEAFHLILKMNLVIISLLEKKK